MKIRPAEVRDLQRVNDLLRQVLSIHAEGRPDIFTDGRKKYTDEELCSIFKNEDTPVYVCETDGLVVGYAFCIKKIIKDHQMLADRRELYIDDLCVDEKYRGRHIGTALYNYVYKLAADGGFDALTLNVWALNAGAMRFYEKCGFTALKTVMEKKINRV